MSKTINIKPFKLHPGQQKVRDNILKYIDDGFHEHVLVAPRQWGKSTLALDLIIRFTLIEKKYGWVVFHYYSAAKNFFITKLKPLLKKYPNLIDSINETDLRIRFVNGGMVELKGSDNPAGMRTATLDYLIMDEFAFQRKEVYDETVSAMLMRRGKFVLFISTPNGRNHFYDKYQQGLSDKFTNIHSYRSDIYETNDEVMIKNILSQKDKVDELTYKQEYLAEFVDEAGYVFSNVSANVVEHIVPIPSTINNNEIWSIGIDVAMKNDRTVITCINENYEVIYWKRFEFTEQSDILTLYNNVKKSLDFITSANENVQIIMENNFERSLSQLLSQDYKIIEFSTQTKSKQYIISNLALALQKELLKIPRVYKQIIDELINYRYKTSTNGNKITEGIEDDCVISLALAVHSMNRVNNKIFELVRE